MSSNVVEWSLTHYQNPSINAADENARSATRRVLHGGSRHNPRSLARATYRTQHDWLNRFDSYGFRFVCRPVYP